MNEERMQANCIQWFWNNYPAQRRMLFHVQQSAYNRIQGSRFKAIGVTKGVSDLVLILNGAVHFIELKLPNGVHSEEQIDFNNKVTSRGHTYVTIRSFEEFKDYIKKVV